MTDKGMGDELRRLLNACQISPSYASKASVKLRDALWDNRHAIVTTLALPVPVAGETRLEKEEAAHLRTIDQRDEAEQCIGKIYFKIIGRSPEWSNHFGYDDALQEIEEAIFILRDATPEATIELRNGATAERVKAIRSLYTRPNNSAVVKALDCQEFMPLALRPLENPNHDPGEHQVLDAETAYIFQLRCSRDLAERIIAALNAGAALAHRSGT